MAITQSAGRQWPLIARVDFTYTDLDADAQVQTDYVLPAISLPANSIVIGGGLAITTAFVGPTVATLDVGDGAVATRFVTDANLLAAALTEFTADETARGGFKYTEADYIDVRLTTTVAVASAGAGHLWVMYYVDGKANEVQE